MSTQRSSVQANACPWCGVKSPGLKKLGSYNIRKDEFQIMAKDLHDKRKRWPVLKPTEGYRTHPKTQHVVRNWCEAFGPCKCIKIGLFGDDVCCNATAPRNGGCQCEKVKRQEVVDKMPAAPAPAPAAPAPAPPAPAPQAPPAPEVIYLSD